MTIFNLGSINVDHVYRVPHLPRPGETLAAYELQTGLGGKGANMSVAAARAGAHVAHIGAVGSDGLWAKERLTEYGVDTRTIAQANVPTGHAIITVDDHGENAITLYAGANQTIAQSALQECLSAAKPNDLIVTQNETNAQETFCTLGSKAQVRVCYAAAPFDVNAVRAVLDHLDLLILNEVEAAQLVSALGTQIADLPVQDIVVTLGAQGCRWYHTPTGETKDCPAYKVTPIDTTGAGDTFTGFLLAGLDRGLPMAQALTLASKAAAIMVTRVGTADVIPDLKDIEDFTFALD